jgi:hypothetical protein
LKAGDQPKPKRTLSVASASSKTSTDSIGWTSANPDNFVPRATSSAEASAAAEQAYSGGAVLSGWFRKQPEKRGKAKRRFFELHFLAMATAELRYFEKAVSGDERAPERLQGKNQRGECVVNHNSGVNVLTADCNLRIVNADRTWYFTAETAEECDLWGNMLMAVVDDSTALQQGRVDPKSRFAAIAMASQGVAVPMPPQSAAQKPTRQQSKAAVKAEKLAKKGRKKKGQQQAPMTFVGLDDAE